MDSAKEKSWKIPKFRVFLFSIIFSRIAIYILLYLRENFPLFWQFKQVETQPIDKTSPQRWMDLDKGIKIEPGHTNRKRRQNACKLFRGRTERGKYCMRFSLNKRKNIRIQKGISPSGSTDKSNKFPFYLNKKTVSLLRMSYVPSG